MVSWTVYTVLVTTVTVRLALIAAPMKRFILLSLSLIVDLLQFFVTPLMLEFGLGWFLDVVLDLLMASLLIWWRGFKWIYLPTFVVELIPGFNEVPLWTVVVLLSWKETGAWPTRDGVTTVAPTLNNPKE